MCWCAVLWCIAGEGIVWNTLYILYSGGNLTSPFIGAVPPQLQCQYPRDTQNCTRLLLLSCFGVHVHGLKTSRTTHRGFLTTITAVLFLVSDIAVVFGGRHFSVGYVCHWYIVVVNGSTNGAEDNRVGPRDLAWTDKQIDTINAYL